MVDKEKALAFRWFSDYHFYKQMAKREERPSGKKHFQERAKEAKKEYDAIMERIGNR